MNTTSSYKTNIPTSWQIRPACQERVDVFAPAPLHLVDTFVFFVLYYHHHCHHYHCHLYRPTVGYRPPLLCPLFYLVFGQSHSRVSRDVAWWVWYHTRDFRTYYLPSTPLSLSAQKLRGLVVFSLFILHFVSSLYQATTLDESAPPLNIQYKKTSATLTNTH